MQVGRTYAAGASEPALTPALTDISLDLAQGQSCALVGPSGSGKSTLLQLIGLLDRPSQGHLSLHGVETAGLSRAEAARLRNRDIGFVFQAFHLLPRLTALENVALPLLYRGEPPDLRRAKAHAALDEVGLADRADARPVQLSGGQRQRVAVARAVVGAPRLLLADEPTGNLDSRAAAEVMDLFDRIAERQGVTLVMVTHDPALARRCRRQVSLSDGRVVADTRAGP